MRNIKRVCFQSGHSGSKIPANATMWCCSVPEQRLLIFHPWRTNQKMHLNTWDTMKTTRPCTVYFTQWGCCFAEVLNAYSLRKCDSSAARTFTLLFYDFLWAERDCQQPQKFCAMCLGNICQARPRTSPNARGCFKLACAPRSAGSKNPAFSVPAFQRKRSTFCRTGKLHNL